jgi:hypothetical protein
VGSLYLRKRMARSNIKKTQYEMIKLKKKKKPKKEKGLNLSPDCAI